MTTWRVGLSFGRTTITVLGEGGHGVSLIICGVPRNMDEVSDAFESAERGVFGMAAGMAGRELEHYMEHGLVES